MSFFQSFAQNVQKAAEDVGEKVKKFTEDMMSPPEEISCQHCSRCIPVPENLFDWICVSCSHMNHRGNSTCENCRVTRPNYSPTLQCPACNEFTEVPANRLTSIAAQTSNDVNRFMKSAMDSTKQKFQELSGTPPDFECSECDFVLETPEWSCSSCTYKNLANSSECSTCHASRPENTYFLTCNNCQKLTKVPSNKFLSDVRRGTHQLTESARKTYYDLADKPYVACNKCKHTLELQNPTTNATIICDRCNNVIIL